MRRRRVSGWLQPRLTRRRRYWSGWRGHARRRWLWHLLSFFSRRSRLGRNDNPRRLSRQRRHQSRLGGRSEGFGNFGICRRLWSCGYLGRRFCGRLFSGGHNLASLGRWLHFADRWLMRTAANHWLFDRRRDRGLESDTRRRNRRYGCHRLRGRRRNRSGRHCRRYRARRLLSSLMLLLDGPQNIAGTGDVGEIEFRPDLFFFARSTGRRSAGKGFSFRFLKVLPDPRGLFDRDGAGVRFLLGDADLWQDIQDSLTFHFQFPCQIVDANLIHSALNFLRAVAAKSSYQPHGVI